MGLLFVLYTHLAQRHPRVLPGQTRCTRGMQSNQDSLAILPPRSRWPQSSELWNVKNKADTVISLEHEQKQYREAYSNRRMHSTGLLSRTSKSCSCSSLTASPVWQVRHLFHNALKPNACPSTPLKPPPVVATRAGRPPYHGYPAHLRPTRLFRPLTGPPHCHVCRRVQSKHGPPSLTYRR